MNIHNRRKRIIQLVVLAIFISFLSTTIISIHSLDSLIKYNTQSLTNLLSSSIYDSVRNAVIKPFMVARLISGDNFLVNLLRIEQSYTEDYIGYRFDNYLTGIKRRIDFDSAFIVPASCNHIFGLNKNVMQLNPLSKIEYTKYDTFINSGRSSAPFIQRDPFHDERKMLYIFSRIADDDGKVVGLCGVGILMEMIQGILRNFERQYNVRINLIDWDGKCMLSTGSNSSNTQIIEDLPKDFRQNREFAYVENNNGGYTITRYLNDIGWFLVIKGENVEGKNAFTHIILGNIIAIVVIFLLLFLAMHFLMHSERTHLENKALTDELTGIANRAGFESAIERQLSESGENGVLFIFDLDHFKEVNDNLGHPAGDLLLKQTAQKLQSLIRTNDILARLGGDEFVVYCSGLKEQDQIAIKAENIRMALMQHYELQDGMQFTVSTSIGIASYPNNGNTYDLLYKNADKALYASKQGGRNKFTIFDG